MRVIGRGLWKPCHCCHSCHGGCGQGNDTPPKMPHRLGLHGSVSLTDRHWQCLAGISYSWSARQSVWASQRLGVLSLLAQGNRALRCHTDSASIFMSSVAFTNSLAVCRRKCNHLCLENKIRYLRWVSFDNVNLEDFGFFWLLLKHGGSQNVCIYRGMLMWRCRGGGYRGTCSNGSLSLHNLPWMVCGSSDWSMPLDAGEC